MAFLEAHSADAVPHLAGSLLSHLAGTCALLQSWGNANDLCLAGLCHAAYGTDGFPACLIDLSRRNELAHAIGNRPEGLVYLYASCDRPFVYPQIGRTQPLRFRDRFTGAVFAPTERTLRDFLEITLANELEIARGDPEWLERNRDSLCDLFARCRALVSEAAYACFRETCPGPTAWPDSPAAGAQPRETAER